MTSIVTREAEMSAATGPGPGGLGRARGASVPLQLASAGVAGVASTVALRAGTVVPLVVLAALVAGVLGQASTTGSTGRIDLHRVLSTAAWTLASLTVVVVLTDLGERVLWHATLVMTVMVTTLALAQLVARATAAPLRAVLVGGAPEVEPVRRAWSDRSDVQVVGVVDVEPRGAGPSELADVVVLAERRRADAVVVVPGAGVDGATVRRLGWMLERSRVRLSVVIASEGVARRRAGLTETGGTLVTHIGPSVPAGWVAQVKGAIDRVVGAALLALFLPLLLALALTVRLDSPGPAFFRQTRIGLGGRPFTLWKLRTMTVGAEDALASLAPRDDGNGVLFKVRRDPRVTRVGRVLRQCSLDELPQLLNVVRGEMSLVGPRPALPTEVARYDDRARRRLAVRPGLTGLWQVRGRSNLSWEESVALDLHYTDNITLARDLAICVATVRAVASRKGAY